MTKLSVNINKLATLRNARGKNNPDVLSWAQEIEAMGVYGITVHPRPDERHIRYQDVRLLRPLIKGELNIEGYPDERWLELVAETKPDQATLVPDPPENLTSNAGFRVRSQATFLKKAIGFLKARTPKTRVSIFIEPGFFSGDEARSLIDFGTDRIEMYTELFAESFLNEISLKANEECNRVLGIYRELADTAIENGLGLNAGHDLTSENLPRLLKVIPEILEVSIGHALICDALQLGMPTAIEKYKTALAYSG